MGKNVILIAGPTASGKSALAMDLAKSTNGVIINSDSMQVYDGLRIITARPSVEDETQCEHVLFGHRDPGDPYSVADWLGEAKLALNEVHAAGKTAIFTGGTGLYFSALLEGISAIPEPKPEIRKTWRELAETSPDILHSELQRIDKGAAQVLGPADVQRMVRALEVMESTGKSILEWQKLGRQAPVLAGMSVRKILVMPERSILHQRINARALVMLEEGALDEVATFLTRSLKPTRTAMKAIGVPQIAEFLNGDSSREEALEKIKIATRQYAKRQCTWFNNQLSDEWEIASQAP